MTNTDVINFLKRNPSLSLSGLEKEASIPSSMLSKAISGNRNLNDEHLTKLSPVLKRYGFHKSDGAKIISIVNNKGGVAKTTTCSNLGRALHLEGYKVLLCDLDQQGNLSQTYDINDPEEELYQSLSFKIDAPIQNCIMEIFPGFDICPSTIALGQAALDLQNNQLKGYKRLSKVLDQVRNEYDFILIDCPPSLDIMTGTALVASDSVVLPVQPEEHAVKGLKNVFNLIDQMKDLNDHIQIEGILFTMVTSNTTLHKSYMEAIKEGMPHVRVFDTLIRRSISIPEATATHQSIFDYDKSSNGAKDYKNITLELIGETKLKKK
ncbi:ParA family protein [Sediminitomix flava]|uniref:Chromosome partitioning protein n=1 Tax=Sediminitomix flava TaxID=379075 RepID=A0A315YZ04_SEDFL|nr:ParA family protein [Sediminitomix flava]PWJ34990.1 chromosome partitioning protein [Sediminitomix flava]